MLMYPIWLNLIGKNHRLNVKLVTAEQLLPRASPDFWAGLDRDLGRAEVIRPWGGGAPQLLSTEKVQKCSLTHLWAHSEKTVALQVLEIRHPAYNKAHRVHPSPHLGLKLEYLLISTQIWDAMEHELLVCSAPPSLTVTAFYRGHSYSLPPSVHQLDVCRQQARVSGRS